MFDVIVIGAGAAGLYCAIETAKRGRKTLVLDHSAKPAEKIRISGGGRCNFTNIHTSSNNFIAKNRHFCKSALKRHTPQDFMDRMMAHELTWNEKTLGQLFCDQKSNAIIKMLLDDLDAAGGELRLSTSIQAVSKPDDLFHIETDGGDLSCQSLIIASGGLSIPKMGASRFGYDVARQFGHDIVPTEAALVPFTFSGPLKEAFAELSGVSTDVNVTTKDKTSFKEAMLFTHRGLSGPAMLQASSYWNETEDIDIHFRPDVNFEGDLKDARNHTGKIKCKDWLARYFPARLADWMAAELLLNQPIGALSKAQMETLLGMLQAWPITPTGTEGYRTAEVTRGGVNTDDLSSRTMESSLCAGLYFIGEVVDVTGWLGGYNFQWAWASGWAAGQAA